MTLPCFDSGQVARAVRFGSAAEARRARQLVKGASDAMRDAAIHGHWVQFGYLRSWLTAVAA